MQVQFPSSGRDITDSCESAPAAAPAPAPATSPTPVSTGIGAEHP